MVVKPSGTKRFSVCMCFYSTVIRGVGGYCCSIH